MSLHGYAKERRRFVDRKAGVEEFEGWFQGRKKVVIRTEVYRNLEECNAVISAALSLASLKHSHILRLYDCFLEPIPASRWRVVVITELSDSSVAQEITRRKVTNELWTDEELCSILYNLSTALSYAESKGIAHPHISLQSVYISQGVYKLGGFQQVSTLPSAGSALYLSPEARVAQAQALRHSGNPPPPFDLYKSAVFSLAVTLATMALLEPPWKFGELLTRREAVDRVVREVETTHHELSTLLSKMLQWDAEARMAVAEIVEMGDKQSEKSEHRLQIAIPESPLHPDTPSGRCSLMTPQVRFLAKAQSPFCCKGDTFNRLFQFQTTDSQVGDSAGWTNCVVCGEYFDKRNWSKGRDPEMKELCSEACVNSYRQTPRAKMKFCSVCSRRFPETTNSALTLPCGDVICSVYCLSRYCSAHNIHYFFLSGVWECVKCKRKKNYATLCDGKTLNFSEYVNRLCQKCWTNKSEVEIARCGHRCCRQCTKQFLVVFCPVCTNYG